MGRSRSPRGSDRSSRRHRSSSRDRRRSKRGSDKSRSPSHRNRSRSPRRSPTHKRHYSRSPTRGHTKGKSDQDRYHRDRGYSQRDRSKSPSPPPSQDSERQTSDKGEEGELDDEQKDMMKIMGFAKFNTTKGKHVPGSCNTSATNIKIEKKYRQYMNRRGGFNRPLDPMK